MKKLIVLLALGFFMQTTGFAQELKFGHINFQQLLSQMPERKEAEKQYQKEAQSIRSELETMQVEYNNKYENFMNQRDTLSEFIQQSRMEEIQNLEQRISQYQQTAQQRLQQTQQQLMQPVVEKANKAIQEVGEENGFIYIFDTGGLRYYSKTQSVNTMPMVKKKLGIAE